MTPAAFVSAQFYSLSASSISSSWGPWHCVTLSYHISMHTNRLGFLYTYGTLAEGGSACGSVSVCIVTKCQTNSVGIRFRSGSKVLPSESCGMRGRL